MSESVIEKHPLAPFLPQHARLLMLGSFPPPKKRWKMDFYYPNFQNDMWRIYGLLFFSDADYFLNRENKSFHLPLLQQFLSEQGIAIYDAATEVKRLQNNASDRSLQVVKTIDLTAILKKIPACNTLVTTGDKASATLLAALNNHSKIPKIGDSLQLTVANREITLYRLPSSSRAYPLALNKKAEAYRLFFQKIGFL